MSEQEVKAQFIADISGFQSNIKQAVASMSGFEKSAESSSQSISSAVSSIGKTMAVAGAAVTAMGVKSVKSYGSFEQSLNSAAVVAGGTAKDIQGLADVANKMGADLPLSAQDAADAMLSMAKDGASLDSIKKEFPAIAEAATAAGADLQTTASVVQQAMNIWGDSLDSPQQAAAILTETANLSNASIEDMQQALATIGGTASNAGISMQDISEAIGLMTNKGFSAAQASQDLNHALLLMQAPSDKGAKQMAALGLSMTDAQGNMKPLPQILNEIGDSMDGMTSSQKAAALKTMFGSSGMAAILPLMNSVKDTTDNTSTSWGAYSKALQGASSDTATATSFLKDQATEMQKNLGAKIEQVGGNWESLRNTAMSASSGVVGSIVDMMNSALSWATTTNSAIGSGIRTFLGLSPVIGAAVLATGSFLTASTKIGSAMGAVGTAIKGLFLSPLGLVIVAIAALVAAFAYVYQTSEQFRNSIADIGKAITTGLAPAFDFAKQTISSFTSGSVGLFQQFATFVTNVFLNMAKSINFSALSDVIISGIKGIIAVANALAPVFTFITNTIVSFVSTAINGFIDLASQITNSFTKVVQGFDFSVLTDTIIVVFSAIMDVVISVGNVVSSVIDVISNTSKISANWSFVTGIFTGIQTVAGFLSSAIVDLINGFLNTGAIQSAWNAVVDVVNAVISIVQAAIDIVKSLYDNFKSIDGASSVFTNIGTLIGNIVTIISNVIGAVANFVGALMKIQAVKDIIQTVVVTAAALFVAFKAYSIVAGIFNGIKTAIMVAKGAMVLFNLVMAANPIGLIITALVALVAGLVYFFTMTETGKNLWSAFVDFLKSSLDNLVSIFQDIWNTILIIVQTVILGIQMAWAGFVAVLSALWQGIVVVFSTIWDGIVISVVGIINGIIAAWNGLIAILSALWSGITAVFSAIWNGLVAVVTTIVNGIVAAWNFLAPYLSAFWQANVILFTTIWNVLVSVVTGIVNGIVAVWNGFTGIISAIWNGIIAVATAIWNAILTTITAIVTTTVNTVSSIWNGLIGIVSGIWNAVSSVVSSVWNAIVNVVRSMASNAVSTLSSIWSAISGVVSSIWNGAKNVISGVWNAIVSVVSSMARSAFNGLRSVWSGISGFVSGLWNGVKGVISGVWNGIVSTISNLANSAINGLKGAWNGISGWVSGIWNGVKSAIQGAMNFDLFGAGSAIMNGFLNGLKSVWGSITSFVGGIAKWIKEHKGPISYDKRLLIPAGNSIMNGLNDGLVSGFEQVKNTVSGVAGTLADTFNGSSDYRVNPVLGDGINMQNGAMSVNMSATSQPAYINVKMGQSTYGTFVSDISNAQGQAASLNKTNSVQL